MEPIEVSAADSSGSNSDPFNDDATDIVFGNGNTADQAGSQNPDASVAATAALGGPATTNAATGTAGAAATAPGGSSGTPLTTWLLYGAIALVALHFLKHKQ